MITVAIDGPAGAGKSSVSKAVAEALGFLYLDSGALYRAVALAALERELDPDDGASLGRLASALEIEAGQNGVRVDGVDVTERIRGAQVNAIVSKVSAHREVREALLQHQRDLAARGGIVIEGRDIGVTVAPEAAVKVFLTASLPERARRRGREMGLDDDDPTLSDLESALSQRDAADTARAVSPLAQAGDALVIDSTDLSFDQVVERIVEEVRVRAHGT